MVLLLAGLLALCVPSVHAADYYVEAGSFTTREDASAAAAAARKAGLTPRVVKRFELNHGFEFVVLVEGLKDAASATATAAALEKATSQRAVIFAPEAPAAPSKAPDQARTAAEWVARAAKAVGGETGGADALARAGAVHFVVERALRVGEKEVTVRQEYWRDGTNRRLDISTYGAGKDSVAVTTASSAWIKSGGTVTPRDIGVLVGMIDSFSPESVLTIALGAHALLASPEVSRFTLLEGAEDGLRLGTGGDESATGLAWIDVDPTTDYLRGARFVTTGGPIEWDLRGWKESAPGVIIPTELHIRRADGRRETLRVKALDVTEHAAAGVFAAPS